MRKFWEWRLDYLVKFLTFMFFTVDLFAVAFACCNLIFLLLFLTSKTIKKI